MTSTSSSTRPWSTGCSPSSSPACTSPSWWASARWRRAGAYAAEDLLPRMARILAEGTGAARADVWLRSGDTFHDGAVWPLGVPPLPPARATQAGVPAYPADRILPVRHQGEVLGALSVSKRPGESLTPTEGRRDR